MFVIIVPTLFIHLLFDAALTEFCCSLLCRCSWRLLADRIRCLGSVPDKVSPDLTYQMLHAYVDEIDRTCKNSLDCTVWKSYWLRLRLMMWQHLVSLILMLFFLSSTYQIDSIYCRDWGSVRSMSTELPCTLFTLSDRAWISSSASTTSIVCDWQ